MSNWDQEKRCSVEYPTPMSLPYSQKCACKQLMKREIGEGEGFVAIHGGRFTLEEINEMLQKDGISNRSSTDEGIVHLFPDRELQRTREEKMVLIFCRRGRAEGTIWRWVIARNAKGWYQ